MPGVPSALQSAEWVGRASHDGSSHERPRRQPSSSEKPPTPRLPSRQSSLKQRQVGLTSKLHKKTENEIISEA